MKKPAAFVVFFLFIPILYADHSGALNPNEKRMLVLVSYHSGFTWSDDVVEGISEEFGSPNDKIQIHIEYMDTRRWYGDKEYETKLADIYAYKYGKTTFDLIISIDDNAYNFLRKYRDRLFQGAPVVFCGVNFFNEEQLAWVENFTGIVESLDVKGTIDLMIRLFPELRRIIIISDKSSFGRMQTGSIREDLDNFQDGDIRFEIWDELGIGEFNEKAGKLEKGSAILYVVIVKDSAGTLFNPSEHLPEISANARVPIFGVDENLLPFGVIGGSLKSGVLHGKETAEMAKRILAGTPISQVPIVKQPKFVTKLRYDLLKRFGVSSDNLPNGVLVLGKPFSFYETYKTLVWGASLFTTVLLALFFALVKNIGERKKTEKELVENRERFELAMKFTNDGLYDWNLETNEIYYSPGWKKMLGYEDDEIKNDFSEWERLTEPEDAKSSWVMLKEVLEGKRDRFEKEFQMRHRDGHWVHILSRANIIFNQEGKGIRVVGTHVDISARKSAEDALKKSEMLHREAQRVAHIGHWELNPSIGTPVWSEEIFRIFGLDPERGEPSFTGHEAYIHPEDWPTLDRAVRKAGTDGTPFDLVFKIVKADKKIGWMHAIGTTSVDDEGNVIKLFGTAQDVTKIKMAEKALEESQKNLSMAQEIAHIGSWKYDAKTGSLYWSDELYHIYGLDPAETSAGLEHAIGMIHPDDKFFAEGIFGKALKDGLPYEIEYRITRPDGEERVVQGIGNTKKDGNGNVLSVYGTGQDITERKRVEEKLQKYSVRLEEMVEERTKELRKVQAELLLKERLAVLGHFAGNISHEIRNPLAAIDTSVWLLNRKLGDRDERVEELLERISSNVRKAAAIIESLLNLTRMEKPKIEKIDLKALVFKTLRGSKIPDTVEISTCFPETEMSVRVDPEQIRMAMKNVIRNAVQAMDESGKLTISMRCAKPETVEITIADTGPGIAPENIENVFGPLFTTKVHGIGFGLSITKMIVENHGGTIRAESDSAKGAAFTLTLPSGMNG